MFSASFGAPVKLNGALTLGGNVESDFRFSADGGHVLYVADQEVLSYDCVAEKLFWRRMDSSFSPYFPASDCS
jgi:hypothetical protein